MSQPCYEFSWSPSRRRHFDLCPLAYHLRYHLAWGGWDRGAPPAARACHALKGVRPAGEWISQLVSDALRAAFLSGSRSASEMEDLFAGGVGWRLGRAFEELDGGLWPSQPKATALFEIFDGRMTPNSAIAAARRAAAAAAQALREHGVFGELAGVPAPSRVDTGAPLAFLAEGVKALVSPCVLWCDGGKGLRWVCVAGEADGAAMEAERGAAAALLGVARWRFRYADSWGVSLMASGDGRWFPAYAKEGEWEVRRLIQDSVKRMCPLEEWGPAGRLRPDMAGAVGEAVEEAARRIPPRSSGNGCARCSFRSICPAAGGAA